MFDQYSPKEWIGFAATVGGILFLVISVVSAQWASVRRAEMRAQQAEHELALKQQMIERGMSADEIATVFAAGQASAVKKPRCREESVDEPVRA